MHMLTILVCCLSLIYGLDRRKICISMKAVRARSIIYFSSIIITHMYLFVFGATASRGP